MCVHYTTKNCSALVDLPHLTLHLGADSCNNFSQHPSLYSWNWIALEDTMLTDAVIILKNALLAFGFIKGGS